MTSVLVFDFGYDEKLAQLLHEWNEYFFSGQFTVQPLTFVRE